MVVRDACSGCGSTRFKKNGHMHSGKQNHRCKACGRQFVASAAERIIADEQRTLIEHLLRERISLRGICRAVGVSLTWLLHFMVERFAACPDHLHAQLPVRPTVVVIRQLEAEADEMWSFVGKKANKPWLWWAKPSNWVPTCPSLVVTTSSLLPRWFACGFMNVRFVCRSNRRVA